MYIKEEINFDYLIKNCWSRAVYTLKRIREKDKEDDFVDLVKLKSGNDIFSLKEMNDFLKYDYEYIYEMLDIEM